MGSEETSKDRLGEEDGRTDITPIEEQEEIRKPRHGQYPKVKLPHQGFLNRSARLVVVCDVMRIMMATGFDGRGGFVGV